MGRRRRVPAFAVGVAAAMLLASCVQPYSVTEGVPVYVLADHFHSGVLIQEGSSPSYTYTFYTFGDRRWYLQGERGLSAALRAALLKSDAVVAEGTITTGGDVESILDGVRLEGALNGWRFLVPRDALDRALDFVSNDLISNPGAPITRSTRDGFDYTFYESEESYHAFYSCVQFTAKFLNVAGIDFEPVWYFYTNDILRDRLNALTDMVF